MIRSLFGLALFLGFVQFAGAQDTGKKITIRWYGQSFFQIETSDKTLIVTDPHAMPEYNRNVVRADLVTCSHMHSDHVQVEILENSKEAKIYYGLDPKSKRSIFNPISAKFKNVTFYDVESDHDPDGGMTRGKTRYSSSKWTGCGYATWGIWERFWTKSRSSRSAKSIFY